MRTAVVLLFVFLGVWVVAGAPVPITTMGPLPTNPDAATFHSAVEDLDPEVWAQKYGQAPEDPERRRVRLAVIDAAEQARLSPCNERFRQRLVKLTHEFLDLRRTKSRTEVTMVNGREMNVTDKLNKPAFDAINAAVTDGYFRPEDFSQRNREWSQLVQYLTRGKPCQ